MCLNGTEKVTFLLIGLRWDKCVASALNGSWLFGDVPARLVDSWAVVYWEGQYQFSSGVIGGMSRLSPFSPRHWQTAQWQLPVMGHCVHCQIHWRIQLANKKRGKYSCKKDIISSCQDWLHIWCLNNRARVHCLYCWWNLETALSCLENYSWNIWGACLHCWHFFYWRVNIRTKMFSLIFSNSNRLWSIPTGLNVDFILYRNDYICSMFPHELR